MVANYKALRGFVVFGGVLLGGVGCGKASFPTELFTVEAVDADYPVMLSKAPEAKKGRDIEAWSGTSASVSQSTYSTGNAQVTVTRTEVAKSELSASQKLAALVRRRDKWIQLEECVYEATLFSSYGFSSAAARLTIHAEAHK